MHLGRFLHFSQKVVGVTLKTEVLSATANLRVEQNLVHLGRFLHFGVTLNRSGLHLNQRGDASLARNPNDHLRVITNIDPVFDNAEIGSRKSSVEPENSQTDIDKTIYDLDLQGLESFKNITLTTRS